MNLFISHGTEKDLQRMSAMAKARHREWWTVNAKVQENDLIAIYVKRPHSGIAGLAKVVQKETRDGARNKHPGRPVIDVEILEAVDPPLKLAEIQRAIPDWRWPRMTLSQARVPEEYAAPLLKLMRSR